MPLLDQPASDDQPGSKVRHPLENLWRGGLTTGCEAHPLLLSSLPRGGPSRPENAASLSLQGGGR